MPVEPWMERRLTRWAKNAQEATAARDKFVVEAIKAGGSLREVAALVGLSHAGVKRIVQRAK